MRSSTDSARGTSKAVTARRKACGIHYTLKALAEFLAARLADNIRKSHDRPLRILDPACGDGALLEALLSELTAHPVSDAREVVAVESDAPALQAARTRLARFADIPFRWIECDFLQLVRCTTDEQNLWDRAGDGAEFDSFFDVIIANPPYVRTQQLGSPRARELARRYGLKGRVDLYQAFLVAATRTIRPEGQLGIILSNRFLSTLAGTSLRTFLAQHYQIQEVIDLGDTQLFDAAVLPATLIARRGTSRRSTKSNARFVKIYACSPSELRGSRRRSSARTVLDILASGREGVFATKDGTFRLSRGFLNVPPHSKDVWSLTTPSEAEWLRRLEQAAGGIVKDLADLHVGIKTTADEVFIRRDWELLPAEVRPEPELIRPLVRHEDAHRWAIPPEWSPRASVLYPHRVTAGRRQTVDLAQYPRARAYFELHRVRLERRKYVLDAGRKWYEVWVPQDPRAWAKPKIVFPDIRSEPAFYVDTDGNVVDGDCYWLTLRPGVPLDFLYLILAVTNSQLMTRFHDVKFPNRLYSGRRRYISQYVSRYPYPAPDRPATREIIQRAKQVVQSARRGESKQVGSLAAELDQWTCKAFGLSCERADS